MHTHIPRYSPILGEESDRGSGIIGSFIEVRTSWWISTGEPTAFQFSFNIGDRSLIKASVPSRCRHIKSIISPLAHSPPPPSATTPSPGVINFAVLPSAKLPSRPPPPSIPRKLATLHQSVTGAMLPLSKKHVRKRRKEGVEGAGAKWSLLWGGKLRSIEIAVEEVGGKPRWNKVGWWTLVLIPSWLIMIQRTSHFMEIRGNFCFNRSRWTFAVRKLRKSWMI